MGKQGEQLNIREKTWKKRRSLKSFYLVALREEPNKLGTYVGEQSLNNKNGHDNGPGREYCIALYGMYVYISNSEGGMQQQ